MYHCYILQSLSNGRLYIGKTNDLQRRLHEHNANHTKSTRNKGPWVLLFAKPCPSQDEAAQWEKRLKAWKNRERILDWIHKEKTTSG